MDDMQIFSELGLAVIPHKNIIVSTGIGTQKQKSSETIDKSYNHRKWINWGINNALPNDVLNAVKANSIIPSTIKWKGDQSVNMPLEYGYYEISDATKKKTFVPVIIDEIEDFIEMNNIPKFRLEVVRDLYWWNMSMADFGLDAERKKIVSLIARDMTECRFGVQNESTGLTDKIYLNANWPMEDDDYIIEMPLIDPYYDRVGQVKYSKHFRFAYPLSTPTPARKFYQDAPWHAVIESGWVRLADKIPRLKEKLMDNQMHLKYIVHIPYSYWKKNYKDWDGKNEKEQLAIKATALQTFNSLLTGVDNTGKSLFLTFSDEIHGKEYAKWEVKELTGKLDSDIYIEDSQEASSHILYSLNVDGSLIGNSPGKEMGAGSGSDKRSALNIFMMSNKVYTDSPNEVLDFVSSFNGWRTTDGKNLSKDGKRIRWRSDYELLTTESTKTPEKRI